MCNIKGTKTEKNLMEAFAGESQARNKYTYFASKAKKEGFEQIAALFLKTADNEKEHAKLWFKELNGIGNTAENLERLRKAETKAQGAAVAKRGSSGFTAQGSGSVEEISVLEQFEQRAQDMAYARSVQDVGARFSASMSRKSGELAEMQSQAESEYLNNQARTYDVMAKNAKHAMVTSIIGQVGGAIVGGIFGGPAGAQMGAQIGGGIASQSNRGLVGSYESQHGGDPYQEGISNAWISQATSKWMR